MRKSKHNNGVRHPKSVKEKAIKLRRQGKTHSEIVQQLSISRGSAWLWTREVKITPGQKLAIECRRNINAFPLKRREQQRELALKNLVPRLEKYTKEDLINKIKYFYDENGRIPLKREFNMYKEYQRRFGSWNKAIRLAGFDPNPVVFAYKFISTDGHRCDSFSEKIIDDYLATKRIKHERNISYPESPKLRADFTVKGKVFIEFFGLAGEVKAYDELIDRKRTICVKNGITLLEIYPKDLFPVNRLDQVLIARL